jgi:hypothetical protein
VGFDNRPVYFTLATQKEPFKALFCLSGPFWVKMTLTIYLGLISSSFNRHLYPKWQLIPKTASFELNSISSLLRVTQSAFVRMLFFVG